MPTLEDYKQAYYDFTGLTSASARQLAFAGIAIIWIFRNGGSGGLVLPHDLLYPSAFFVVSLAADLFQYFVSSAIWGIFHRVKEKEFEKGSLPEDSILKAPVYLNWPNLAFFYVKVLCVLIAYVQMFVFILKTIRFE